MTGSTRFPFTRTQYRRLFVVPETQDGRCWRGRCHDDPEFRTDVAHAIASLGIVNSGWRLMRVKLEEDDLAQIGFSVTMAPTGSASSEGSGQVIGATQTLRLDASGDRQQATGSPIAGAARGQDIVTRSGDPSDVGLGSFRLARDLVDQASRSRVHPNSADENHDDCEDDEKARILPLPASHFTAEKIRLSELQGVVVECAPSPPKSVLGDTGPAVLRLGRLPVERTVGEDILQAPSKLELREKKVA